MREKTVKITHMNGKEYYVSPKVFNDFNVPESPISVISNYIRGSRGPLIPVHLEEDYSDKTKHVNANFILDVDVTYD